MSRLQVGGLALLIKAVNKNNEGVIVKLLEYYPNGDDWEFVGLNEALDDSHCLIDGDTMFAPSKWLMPLGDQQTQDKLQEEELENV